MGSTTPNALVRGTSTSAPEARDVRGLRRHAKCPKVANAVKSKPNIAPNSMPFYYLLTCHHPSNYQTVI